MKQATRRSAEQILDRAIELTFPASDPIAVEHAFRAARTRESATPEVNKARPKGSRAKRARSKAA